MEKAHSNLTRLVLVLFSLEDALMTAPGEVNKLLQDVLTRFILMLRPHSRNVGRVSFIELHLFHWRLTRIYYFLVPLS